MNTKPRLLDISLSTHPISCGVEWDGYFRVGKESKHKIDLAKLYGVRVKRLQPRDLGNPIVATYTEVIMWQLLRQAANYRLYMEGKMKWWWVWCCWCGKALGRVQAEAEPLVACEDCARKHAKELEGR